MLFSSHIFILLFLPAALLVYLLLERHQRDTWSLGWLVLASLFFYGWWSPPYVLLILISMGVNFRMGALLSRLSLRDPGKSRLLLFAAIGLNLALLGYYKYWNFLLENLGWITGTEFKTASIFLPLGISFFTFQQIAYLVDAHQRQTEEYDVLRYALFVTFFPQLIAGPIVHHAEMLPQFARRAAQRIRPEMLAAGSALFAVGLCKKVVIADGLAPIADSAFGLAGKGQAIPLVDAWSGTLAYTFQIYFDFSGYSDMAVGLGWMFGIVIPINFFSPYKAGNIIEFWRRWHMTLSRFLRDYLYIPLGGNRRGEAHRYVNLMLTMLLGGLWHGAGWTFVIWGGLHGLYLAINHLWQALLWRQGAPSGRATGLYWPSRALTVLAVVVAWVFFRSDSWQAALHMLEGLAGASGTGTWAGGLSWDSPMILLAIAFLLAWFAPNTMEWLTASGTVTHPQVHAPQARYPQWLLWRPTRPWALAMGVATVVGILYAVRDLQLESPFLYFQF